MNYQQRTKNTNQGTRTEIVSQFVELEDQQETYMENLIQNIPVAISLVLPLVLVLMVITNIVVEVLKKLTLGKLPTNIVVLWLP